jgi:TubC N-terminal docking domain
VTPAVLVADLQARGVVLEPRGQQLAIRPPSLVSPAELEVLRQHKAEVLTLLQAPTTPPPGTLDRILGMTLRQFELEGALLEVRVPWWPETLWFVPAERDKAGLVAEAIGVHRVWTAHELSDVLPIAGLPDMLASLMRAREAFGGEVIAVGPSP